MLKISILTDFHRASYAIIGQLFERSLSGLCSVNHRATPRNKIEREVANQELKKSIIIHNTLGDGFVPLQNCYNIALPAHEWSQFPQKWIDRLNQFEEVWTTTDHVKDLLHDCGLKVPCFKSPPALDSDDIPSKSCWTTSDSPRFFAVGEPHFRKGYHLLMQGFTKAFPKIGQAHLTIKTSPTCNWESPRKDITVIKEDWPREKLLAEYAKHDHYVSASLGEGLGLPIAEAIMAELPVCTNFWGGHKSLLTHGGFVEIEHEEIIQPFTSDPAFYAEGQKCAYSSPESISEALKKCISRSAAERKKIVNIAKQFFIQNYGYKVTHKSISNRLEEIKLINSQ
ncbi:glycosyltransferase [Opitutales bacterium]|nr:glycosyltransferase [Opitutales bacterium]